MAKRKLQPFYHNNMILHVAESHVKQIMKMATDGKFSQLKYSAQTIEGKWNIVFDYQTNLGKGKIALVAQEVQFV